MCTRMKELLHNHFQRKRDDPERDRSVDQTHLKSHQNKIGTVR